MTPKAAARLGLHIGIWIAGPVFLLRTILWFRHLHALAGDAHAYWLTAHSDHLYTLNPGRWGAYLYSPAFAQVIRPLAELPFGWFAAIIIVVDVGCCAWLLAPLGWSWVIPILMMMPEEFVLGNVYGVLTLTVVLAVLWRPGWWAFGWLTKITPGVLGLTWHVGRGEWKRAFVSLAWTAGVAGISFALWPAAWFQWVDFLRSSHGDPTVMIRTLAALVLVVVGGRRGWWWCIPVALFISAPVFGLKVTTCLIGLVRLRPGVGLNATPSLEPRDARVLSDL